MSEQENKDKPTTQANHNSIAVKGISAGGDINGNIHIGNTNICNVAEVDYCIGDALPDAVSGGLS